MFMAEDLRLSPDSSFHHDGCAGGIVGRESHGGAEGRHMTASGLPVAVFTAFGIASQAILVCFFAARRWSPLLAQRFGWLAYAFAGLGLPVGAWLFLGGQSWRL